jgi:hypothetical protein
VPPGLPAHLARMAQNLTQEFVSWGIDHGFNFNEMTAMTLQLPQVMQNINASRYLSGALFPTTTGEKPWSHASRIAVGMMIILWDTIITLPEVRAATSILAGSG